jgi:hypothetical protein
VGIYGKKDMGVFWSLYQYVSPMERRAIDDWRSGLDVKRQADMDVFLRQMVKKPKWAKPDIDSLKGKDLKSLYELRWKSQNVPHRIGGYFPADNEFVMLIGWTHNAKKYDPPEALTTIQKRRKQILAGEASLDGYQIITS